MRVSNATLHLLLTVWCGATGHPLIIVLWLLCLTPFVRVAHGALHYAIAVSIIVAAILQCVLASVVVPLWYSDYINEIPRWTYMLLMPDVFDKAALIASMIPPLVVTFFIPMQWTSIVDSLTRCRNLPRTPSAAVALLLATCITAAAVYPTVCGLPYVVIAMSFVVRRSFTADWAIPSWAKQVLVVISAATMTCAFLFQNRFLREQLRDVGLAPGLFPPLLYDLDAAAAIAFIVHLFFGGLSAVVASWALELDSHHHRLDGDDEPSEFVSIRTESTVARPYQALASPRTALPRADARGKRDTFLIPMLAKLGHKLQHYLIVIPLLSVALMSAAIIMFNSIITLAALPMVLLALLTPRRFYNSASAILVPILCAGIMIQYVVLVARCCVSAAWMETFFTSSATWSRVVEVVAAMVSLFVIATSRHAGSVFLRRSASSGAMPPPLADGQEQPPPQNANITFVDAQSMAPSAAVDRALQRLSRKSVIQRILREVRVLFVEFSYLLGVAFVFVAATCNSYLDIPHVVLLVFAALSALLPRGTVRVYVWPPMSIYTAMLVAYSVSMRFFFGYGETVSKYAADGIEMSSLGVRDYDSWELAADFVALFTLAVEWRSHWGRSTRGDAYSSVRVAVDKAIISSWASASSAASVRLWKHRFALIIAGAVFFGLVVLESRSLFVILFLNVYLLNAMLTAYAAPQYVLQVSWRVATVMALLVSAAISAYQVDELAVRIDDMACGGSNATDVQCIHQIGLSRSSTALTWHLLPWVLAVAVCLMQLCRRQVSDEEETQIRQDLVAPHARPQRLLLEMLDKMTTTSAYVGITVAHCSGGLALLSYVIALASRADLITFGYAVFLISGWVGRLPMAYAWAQIMLQYMWDFWFVPEAWDYNVSEGVSLSRLFGVNKTSGDSSGAQILSVLFVFFANLLADSARFTRTGAQTNSDGLFARRLEAFLCGLTVSAGFELLAALFLVVYATLDDTIAGFALGGVTLWLTTRWNASLLLPHRWRLLFLTVVSAFCLLGSYMVIVFRSTGLITGVVSESSAWDEYFDLTTRHAVLWASGFALIILQVIESQRSAVASHYLAIGSLYDGHHDFHEWLLAKAPPSFDELLTLSDDELDLVAPIYRRMAPEAETDRLAVAHRAVLRGAVLAVKYIPPAAIAAVVFACERTSVLGLYELILAVLWIAFSDNVNCGGRPIWRRLLTFIALPLLLLPPLVNIPALLPSNSVQSDVLASLGATDASGRAPLRSTGWSIAIVILALLHRRVTEHFYASTLIRELHADERSNAMMHAELLAQVKDRDNREWAAAQQQLAHAEETLQRVRQSTMMSALVSVLSTDHLKHEAEDKEIDTLLNDDTDDAAIEQPATEVESTAQSPYLAADAPPSAHPPPAPADPSSSPHTPPDSLAAKLWQRLRSAAHWVASKARSWTEDAVDRTYHPTRVRAATEGKPLWLRAARVFIEVAKTHLLELFVLCAVFNAAQSITLFDLIPMVSIVVVAITVYPWPPVQFYIILLWYTVMGLAVKSITYICCVRANLADGPWRTFVVACIIDVPAAAVDDSAQPLGSRLTGTSSTAALDLGLDCVVLTACICLLRVATATGVYSRTQRYIFVADANRGVVQYDRASVDDDDDRDAPTDSLIAPRGSVSSFIHKGDTGPSGHEPSPKDAADLSDGKPAPNDAADASTTSARFKRRIRQLFKRYWGVKRGTGRDLYLFSVSLLLGIILVTTFGYFQLTRTGHGSFMDSVSADLLPGSMVVVLVCVAVVMVLDRGVYVLGSLEAKVLLHLSVTLATVIVLVYWHANVQASNGVTFLLIVFVTGYWCTSAYQIKLGFPVLRRSDPFTPFPESNLRYVGYTVFRAIPFLSELRTLVDWSFTPTSLTFDNWLKVNDIKRYVFERQVAIVDQKEFRGGTRPLKDKLANGALRLVILLLIVFFPLSYYSTFNPNLTPNSVTAVTVELSLAPGGFGFQQARRAATAPPTDPSFAGWMQNAYPALATYDIQSDSRTTQLISVDTCSGQIWTLSPQSERNLLKSLHGVVNGTVEWTLELTVQLSRKASTSAGDLSQTLQSSWQLANQTAQLLIDTIEAPAEEEWYVLLDAFYSPVIMNQPSTVSFFTQSQLLRSCSLKLRTEVDRVLNGTPVRYWCLMCDAPFSQGFQPPQLPSNFSGAAEERDCLLAGRNCPPPPHPYAPVPMYFVVVSDQVPLPNGLIPNVGIIALYTTFILAVGRFVRGTFTASQQLVLAEVGDPKPLATLLRYMGMARRAGDFLLEQRIYLDTIDLVRNPTALLERTGRQRELFDPESGTFYHSTAGGDDASAGHVAHVDMS